jgi:hypothetical protein
MSMSVKTGGSVLNHRRYISQIIVWLLLAKEKNDLVGRNP